MFRDTTASCQALSEDISRFQISLLRGLRQPVNTQFCVLLFINVKFLKYNYKYSYK